MIWLKLALVALLVGGVTYAGVEVRNAFVERAQFSAANDQLKETIKAKDDAIAAAEKAADDARRDAKAQIDKIKGEVDLANQLAAAAVEKTKTIARNLAHANAAIETWKLSSAVAAAAAGMPFPAGVLEPPETGPTAQIERDPCPAAGPSDKAGSGTCVPTLSEGLRLCTAMQGALRTCNGQLEQLQIWKKANQ